jgi:hypothetical protein
VEADVAKVNAPKKVTAPISNGFGPSKLHASGEGRDPKWDTATLNGQPIPEDLKDSLPWLYTDQGAAEANAGKGTVYARTIIDEVQRQADDEDLFEVKHPLEAKASQVRPGFTPRFLSPKLCDFYGGPGARGFEVVKDEHGEPIRHGGLILAEMPNRRADRIRAQRQDDYEHKEKVLDEKQIEEQGRLARDTGGQYRPLRANEVVRDSASGDTAVMGLQSVAGPEPTLVRPPA